MHSTISLCCKRERARAREKSWWRGGKTRGPGGRLTARAGREDNFSLWRRKHFRHADRAESAGLLGRRGRAGKHADEERERQIDEKERGKCQNTFWMCSEYGGKESAASSMDTHLLFLIRPFSGLSLAKMYKQMGRKVKKILSMRTCFLSVTPWPLASQRCPFITFVHCLYTKLQCISYQQYWDCKLPKQTAIVNRNSDLQFVAYEKPVLLFV